MDKNDLELDLLDNGIDFILKGIDELFDEHHVLLGYSNPVDIPTNSYKYGVLHLFSGFLLLLKERLARHIPELIFKGKINEVRQQLAKGKTPNTIDLDEALERLEIGPRVTFSEDELQIIRDMQSFRNQFEHYRISANKHQLWSIVSSFLALIDNFLVRELQINLEASAETQELSKKIHTIEAVWRRIDEQRKRDWREEIERLLSKFQKVKSKVLDDLDTTYFVEKGATEVFITCPQCDQETLIVVGEFKGICSNEECSAIYPITSCDRCGQTITGFSWEINLCQMCADLELDDG